MVADILLSRCESGRPPKKKVFLKMVRSHSLRVWETLVVPSCHRLQIHTPCIPGPSSDATGLFFRKRIVFLQQLGYPPGCIECAVLIQRFCFLGQIFYYCHEVASWSVVRTSAWLCPALQACADGPKWYGNANLFQP